VATDLYGVRVVGHPAGRRRLVDWRVAFDAYAACDPTAQTEREAYLTHFVYGADFAEHLERSGAEKGYNGPCGAGWLFWDIDRPGDLGRALRDARRLAGSVLDRYPQLDDDALLVFLSGGKGVHVGVPTSLWRPTPSSRFHETAKRFCRAIAERAGVAVDPLIYSKCRLFRAPNSRHPKTGLYKRRLTLEELMHLKPDAIVELARQPEPFRIPGPTAVSPTAVADWQESAGAAERRAVERRDAYRDGGPKLTALTLDFIRDGAPDGERAIRLFRAAANLAEFDCSAELAHDLLTGPALDSGLTPSETKRQIESGLAHARQQQEGGPA
jgi:hypothetical protein